MRGIRASIAAIGLALAGAAAALAGDAAAPAPGRSCPGVTLMACTLEGGSRTLALCLDQGGVVYREGPAGGAPDLVVRRPVRQVVYVPRRGAERYYIEGRPPTGPIHEEITLDHDGRAYTVWYRVDPAAPLYPVSGGVYVFEKLRMTGRRDCDPGSVSGVLNAMPTLGAALEAAGLGWCWVEQRWLPACG